MGQTRLQRKVGLQAGAQVFRSAKTQARCEQVARTHGGLAVHGLGVRVAGVQDAVDGHAGLRLRSACGAQQRGQSQPAFFHGNRHEVYLLGLWAAHRAAFLSFLALQAAGVRVVSLAGVGWVASRLECGHGLAPGRNHRLHHSGRCALQAKAWAGSIQGDPSGACSVRRQPRCQRFTSMTTRPRTLPARMASAS
ncbi:hypothetical protein D3C72_1689130 [compost metagenome]